MQHMPIATPELWPAQDDGASVGIIAGPSSSGGIHMEAIQHQMELIAQRSQSQTDQMQVQVNATQTEMFRLTLLQTQTNQIVQQMQLQLAQIQESVSDEHVPKTRTKPRKSLVERKRLQRQQARQLAVPELSINSGDTVDKTLSPQPLEDPKLPALPPQTGRRDLPNEMCVENPSVACEWQLVSNIATHAWPACAGQKAGSQQASVKVQSEENFVQPRSALAGMHSSGTPCGEAERSAPKLLDTVKSSTTQQQGAVLPKLGNATERCAPPVDVESDILQHPAASDVVESATQDAAVELQQILGGANVDTSTAAMDCDGAKQRNDGAQAMQLEAQQETTLVTAEHAAEEHYLADIMEERRRAEQCALAAQACTIQVQADLTMALKRISALEADLTAAREHAVVLKSEYDADKTHRIQQLLNVKAERDAAKQNESDAEAAKEIALRDFAAIAVAERIASEERLSSAIAAERDIARSRAVRSAACAVKAADRRLTRAIARERSIARRRAVESARSAWWSALQWTSVEDLHPGCKNINLLLKVLSIEDSKQHGFKDVTMADKSCRVTVRLAEQDISRAKVGRILELHSASMQVEWSKCMDGYFMHATLGKWGTLRVHKGGQTIGDTIDPQMQRNMSELVWERS